MSAVPGGIVTISYSRSAAPANRSTSASRVSVACGTSITTKAIFSASTLSATDSGTPKRVSWGLYIVKLDWSSAATSPPACNQNVGTPAARNGSHTDAATPDWLSVTATTSSSTSWLAQSVAPAGSAPGLAGHHLDRAAADAALVRVPVVGRGLGGPQLVGVVEGRRGPVGHHADADRLTRRLVLGTQQIGRRRPRARRIACRRASVIAATCAGRQQQGRDRHPRERVPGPVPSCPRCLTVHVHRVPLLINEQ